MIGDGGVFECSTRAGIYVIVQSSLGFEVIDPVGVRLRKDIPSKWSAFRYAKRHGANYNPRQHTIVTIERGPERIGEAVAVRVTHARTGNRKTVRSDCLESGVAKAIRKVRMKAAYEDEFEDL